MNASRIEFRTLPRRFHAIFDGIGDKDCLGGACEHLDKLNPARWAVPLLEGGETQAVYADRVYQGHMDLVAGRVGAKRYLSLDTLAPGLETHGRWRNTDGVAQTASLFDAWLAEQTRRLPKEVDGIVVGHTSDLHNRGGPRAIRTSSGYMGSASIEERQPFETSDPLEKKIVENVRTDGEIANVWTGGAVYEASLLDSRSLVVLSTEPFDFGQLLNRAWIRSRIDGHPADEAKMWGFFNHRGVYLRHPAIQDLLRREARRILGALKDRGHDQHAIGDFLRYCGEDCAAAIAHAGDLLSQPEDLPAFLANLSGLELFPPETIDSLISGVISEHAKAIADWTLKGGKQAAFFEILARTPIHTAVNELKKQGLLVASSADIFLEIIEGKGKTLRSGVQASPDDLLIAQAEHFLSLKPGKAEVLRAVSAFHKPEKLAVFQRLLRERGVPDEWLELSREGTCASQVLRLLKSPT